MGIISQELNEKGRRKAHTDFVLRTDSVQKHSVVYNPVAFFIAGEAISTFMLAALWGVHSC